jgi:uncharacterized protein with gpF-like domain
MPAVQPEDSYLFQPLVRHRSKMTPKQRELTQDKEMNIAWLYPKAPEASYAREFSKYLRIVIDGFLDFVEPRYNSWVADFHSDAFPDDLDDTEAFINSIQEEIFGDVKAYRTAFLIKKAFEVDTFNITQWGKFTGALFSGGGASIVKEPLFAPEPWLDDVLNNWVNRNQRIWKNVTNEFISRATTIVSENVEQGLLWTNTRDKISRILPDAKRNSNVARANLIARDQTGKLNSSLMQRRMEEAAVKMYRWLTAGDERVRGNPKGKFPKAIPSHYIMNKKTAQWDDPKLISDDRGKTWRAKKGKEEPLQAGWAIQCRCTGIPIFRELLKAVDDAIGESQFF